MEEFLHCMGYSKIMSKHLLNPYQRNSITITLRMLEVTLRKNLSEINNAQRGILNRQNTTLTEEQLEKLRRLSEDALNEIAFLARKLSLPVEEQSSSMEMQGQLFALWSDVQEINSKTCVSTGQSHPN